MRHVTLAAATLAAFALAGAAYADSNFGPRRNGDECWHQQSGNSRGYWSPCTSEQSALAQQRTRAAGKSKTANRPSSILDTTQEERDFGEYSDPRFRCKECRR
jgi:hypothetical protein